MAIARRSTADGSTEGDTTHTVTTPAGAASGDVLIGFWFTRDSTTWSPPGGWTTIISGDDGGGGSGAFIVARLVLSGSPSGSYSATTTGAVDSWGLISAWTGVDTTTPIDCSSGSATTAGGPWEAPSITTVTNGAVLLCFYGDTDAEVGTEPGGMTKDGANNGPGATAYLQANETRASAGATGTRTATGFTARGWSISAALRPAAAAATRVPNAIMLLGVG